MNMITAVGGGPQPTDANQLPIHAIEDIKGVVVYNQWNGMVDGMHSTG